MRSERNSGEPNDGGRKAEDSLGGLELNDDRRLPTSITSDADLFSDFSLKILQIVPTTAVMILFLVAVGTVAP